MAIATFCLHLFLALQIQGSTSATPVFVQTGKDLILNLTEAEIPQNSRLLLWQFNGNSLVTFLALSPPFVEETHTGRIEVLEKEYNVKLKSLQKSDSGIYTAKTVAPREQKLSEYNVTVQDPASPGDLTINCTSSTSSYRILTVTCRAEDSSINITLRCDNKTCNQQGGDSRGVTTSGSSLHIYQLNESVICNHSNQVNWTETIKKIKDPCTKHGESRTHYEYIVFLILLPLIIVITCHIYKKGNKVNVDNTIYALPELMDQTDKLNETAEDEHLSPTTTYSTVGPSLTQKSSKTNTKSQPESVYSQIEKPSKTD
ncbi:uncharacterized protein V3H82_016164 [Fundulus diaphanus]